MFNLPRWYCPQGATRPEHVPTSGFRCAAGPDGGAGTTYGGTYQPGELGWIKTPAGYWVHLVDVLPQHLGRIEVHPRVLRWTMVQGAGPGAYWRVPSLITPVFGKDKAEPICYVSALDQVLGAEGWKDPADLVDLQERLRATAIDVGTTPADEDGAQGDVDKALVDLVVDILAMGHALTRAELVAGGWLTKAVMLRVLIAAAEIPLPEAPDVGA